MSIFQLLLLAVVAVTLSSEAPVWGIPINTNSVIRSFIGGPPDDNDGEGVFGASRQGKNEEKKKDDSDDMAVTTTTTPYPFPILRGINRVITAWRESTMDGISNVAQAAFPTIFGSHDNKKKQAT